MATDAEREHREAPRVPCRGEIDFWIGSIHFSAYYSDISAKGIYIETMNPATPGTRCKMRFSLPGQSKVIEVEGVVIWNSTPMGMGVKFLNLKPDDCAAIKTLTSKTPN